MKLLRKFLRFLRRISFIVLLLCAFIASDRYIAKLDPVTNSMRYQNDFAISLYEHQWKRSSPAIFYGNSGVTAGYIEQDSLVPMAEMGLAYGHITDLKGILQGGFYTVTEQIILGIDAHLMIDSLTEESLVYPWLKPWYQPYVYYYRDYLRDLGSIYIDKHVLDKPIEEKNLFRKTANTIKGSMPDDYLAMKWKEYNDRFGWMTTKDFEDNIEALHWLIQYSDKHNISLKVVWLPWNPKYPHLPYMGSLRTQVDQILADHQVPVLDLEDAFTADKFWDLVHLSHDIGGPALTKEVGEWLMSFD